MLGALAIARVGTVRPRNLSTDIYDRIWVPVAASLGRNTGRMVLLRKPICSGKHNLNFINTTKVETVIIDFIPGQEHRPAHERAVLAPLQAVLAGLNLFDPDMIRDQWLPGGSATLIRPPNILQLDVEGFVTRLPSDGPQLEEYIKDPVVFIDDNIAVIWAPYEFFRDGQLHHVGTNIVNLLQLDGRWLISALADNSRLV